MTDDDYAWEEYYAMAASLDEIDLEAVRQTAAEPVARRHRWLCTIQLYLFGGNS
jgi:hypothetical protein